MIKLIWADDNDYKQWKLVIKENMELEKKLVLSYACDSYKDDLIATLRELLVSKEALIAEMRERNNK